MIYEVAITAGRPEMPPIYVDDIGTPYVVNNIPVGCVASVIWLKPQVEPGKFVGTGQGDLIIDAKKMWDRCLSDMTKVGTVWFTRRRGFLLKKLFRI